jgi:hypothetical protein
MVLGGKSWPLLLEQSVYLLTLADGYFFFLDSAGWEGDRPQRQQQQTQQTRPKQRLASCATLSHCLQRSWSCLRACVLQCFFRSSPVQGQSLAGFVTPWVQLAPSLMRRPAENRTCLLFPLLDSHMWQFCRKTLNWTMDPFPFPPPETCNLFEIAVKQCPSKHAGGSGLRSLTLESPKIIAGDSLSR